MGTDELARCEPYEFCGRMGIRETAGHSGERTQDYWAAGGNKVTPTEFHHDACVDTMRTCNVLAALIR
jgi:hypothetical protein